MKKKIIYIVLCSIISITAFSLLIWAFVDISDTVQGIRHMKSLPEVYGDIDFSYLYKILTQRIIKSVFCFICLGCSFAILILSFRKNIVDPLQDTTQYKDARQQRKLEKAQAKVEKLKEDIEKDA